MNLEYLRHHTKWETKVGSLARRIMTWIGLKFLRLGRRCLRWSRGRCSWCGANCGFDSTSSRKGSRCCSHARDCTEEPDI